MHYMLVEYVPGKDIERTLNSPETSFEEKFALLRQLAEGMMASHDAGCVHRDIKPSNAVKCPNHGVKLIDFGLAREIGSRARPAGTPLYIAPEGAFPGITKPTLDTYAFGVAAYWAFEHMHPYMAPEDSFPILAAMNNRMRLPRSKELAASGLGNLIIACLQKDHARRLKDGHAILEAFDKL